MTEQRIKLRTESDTIIEAVVVSLRVDGISIALGEGLHNIKCKLTPTTNQRAYVGSVMGREVIYERSVKQVAADLAEQQRREASYRVRR